MNKLEETGSCPRPSVSNFFSLKDFFDRSLALIMLVIAAPIIACLVVIVRLSSKGPGLYSQIRVGKDGKPFRIYKIRSMKVDAEEKTGAVWASRKDPRITRLGQFLRASHLDETPQLFNVLRGEMSFIGPRPERPEFVSILEREIDGYSHRLMVKPGVTGLAQLNLPSDTDLNDVRRKLVLDFEYIEKASFSLDLRLILGTALRFATFFGTLPMKLLGIDKKAEESDWAKAFRLKTVNINGETRLDALFQMEKAV